MIVKYCRGNEIIPVGQLVLENRKILFEYYPSFIELGIELSPFKLKLQPGVITCEDPVFEGLFGLFNDSLPDGWGRLLLDRHLIKQGINPGALTPLDRLSYVGANGMGALFYESETAHYEASQIKDLDVIANECQQIQADGGDEFIDELLALNGSSAGARPKILVDLPDGKWIIKFSSAIDPKDNGAIEYAYHLMAMVAGLDVPEARLFKSKYFGVMRFDRQKDKYLHMQTISGLLHIDHRIPSLDYQTIIQITALLTKDLRESEKQFRNAVFNVLSHNRDDHAKNFSFLMNENGVWKVSPAYDLVFSSGLGGEHHTTIMGEGKSPSLQHLLQLAEASSIPQQTALEIRAIVKSCV